MVYLPASSQIYRLIIDVEYGVLRHITVILGFDWSIVVEADSFIYIESVKSVKSVKRICFTSPPESISINAFRTKLQQIFHVMHLGFAQDMTRLKYFHYVK